MPMRKRRQKGLRGSIFALLLADFKRHHGSEGVNKTTKQMHADVIDTPASFHISKPANFFASSLL